MNPLKLLHAIKATLFTSSKCKFDSNYKTNLKIIQRNYEYLQSKNLNDNQSRLLWRTICQYRCQATIRTLVEHIAANIVAFLSLPFIVLLIKPARKATTSSVVTKYLKINFHMAYVIPRVIKDITVESKINEKYVNLNDVLFVLRLFVKNKAFYPEIIAKYLMWISTVRPHLDAVKADYLIQYCEYSAYSSLRKAYLNNCGVGIANICHGEEFISCRSAFSTFDQYFAWDITPKGVHDAMHIESGHFLTFNPCEDISGVPKSTDIRVIGVLWPSIEGKDLNLLTTKLNSLGNHFNIVVRPHPNPAYAHLFESHKSLLKSEISDANMENIHYFIDRCDIVVGYLSAAMLQAAFRGREVIYINDEYIESVREYHDYYKNVTSCELSELDHVINNIRNAINIST